MADFIVEAHYPGSYPLNYPDGWIPIVQDNSRRYCEGYLARAAEKSPRPAYRVRRASDDAIVAQCPASDDPDTGMVLDQPSKEQYIAAAKAALAQMPPEPDGSVYRIVRLSMPRVRRDIVLVDDDFKGDGT